MEIDVRGPRFSAALTCLVLSAAYLAQSTALLAAQVAVFAVAALAGLRWSPYGNLFRLAKRRLRLGPPPAVEPEAGPRFSQLLGMLCTGLALLLIAVGRPGAGWALVLLAVALSGLLATTGLCVGCELYALRRRWIRGLPSAERFTTVERAELGLSSAAPALLVFTAPGCARCPAAEQVVRRVAARRPAVQVAVVDATANTALADAHAVRRAPTVFVLDAEGTVRARVPGVPRPDTLGAALDRWGSANRHVQTRRDDRLGIKGG